MAADKPVEYKARVASAIQCTPSIRRLDLELLEPRSLEFKAGQFLSLRIPREEGRPLYRSYSLAGPEGHRETLTVYLDSEVDGAGVRYLCSLEPGQTLEFKAPLGHFVLGAPASEPLLFVTHISAVGMCRWMAQAALEATPGRSVTLVAEVKDADHLFLADELRALTPQFPSFRYVLTAPTAPPSWTGPRLTLAAEAVRRLRAFPTSQVFICGLGDMVVSVRAALEAAEVPLAQIKVEKWSQATGKGE